METTFEQAVKNLSEIAAPQTEKLNVGYIFGYAASCENMFEQNLKDIKGDERKTTFYYDLSIAEVFDAESVIDTCQRSLKDFIYDEQYISELVLSVNWKSWEHQARGNEGWSKLYSELYYQIYDIVLDKYQDDEEKADYFWHYLD